MGQLIDGIWKTRDQIKSGESGEFRRAEAHFRNWVTPDGSAGPTGEGGFKAEPDRYHLYVSYACPWAHRTLMFRKLKNLEDLIGVSVVHPFAGDEGWTFDRDFDGATGDTLHDSDFLRDIYIRADLNVTTRVTVPVLWDKQRRTIVSNESSEIIRMFNSAFDDICGNSDDYWPEPLRSDIDDVNRRVYDTVNNGVYKAGFAANQSAYDKAVKELFETLDWLESLLADNAFLMGDRVTEADWRLASTLFRFDLVYHTHFKCNRSFLREMANLWDYARQFYQWPTGRGRIADTVHFDHIVHHYYTSHESINPRRIVPINPMLDWEAPHGRGAP